MTTSREHLLNGALAGPFAPFRGNAQLTTAVAWTPWWLTPAADAPAWKGRQPVYAAATLDGQAVQQLSTPWATHTAGLWQQVPSAEGNAYELTAEGQAWSSEDPAPASQLEAGDVNLQVGVDPTGGLDPESPLIVWSAPAQPLSHWQTLRVTAVAQANIITVFLKSAPNLPKRQQAVFWRNAFLRPIGRHKRAVNIVGVGDTHMRLEPEQPQPGSLLQVQISAARAHAHVNLQARDPDLAEVAVTPGGVTRDGDRTLWRYSLTPPAAGLYELRFEGDGGARLLALRLVRVAREVQLVPRSPLRTTYRRVYVLLPPTADEGWFLAAARGSFHGRYTVGFSADDAGMGDFDRRHVIAVNPHHWPEVLTVNWFQQHYPGALFTAVVANSPADLEAWLRAWTP
jgi:hypothetical protein